MKILSRFFLGNGTYITYPHTNSFAAGGKEMLYLAEERGAVRILSLHLATRKSRVLRELGASFPETNLPYLDAALHGTKLATVFDNRAWLMDIGNPADWRCVHECLAPARLDPLPSLSSDGTRLLCMEHRENGSRAIEIDLRTGEAQTLFSKAWTANHLHYCPHDESWAAFSHEGPTETISDRCWIWHAEKAPDGRVAFGQISEVPAKPLCVGHERWGWHDIAGYTIAYAVSPAGKRGLYEIFADKRPARLLWENDVLWHCNMDPSGRFVAVDTTGPLSNEPLSAREFRESTERHMRTDRERGRNISDVGVIDLKNRELLHVAEAGRSRHPYHPHPAISPDGKWLVWNDDLGAERGAWIAELQLE